MRESEKLRGMARGNSRLLPEGDDEGAPYLGGGGHVVVETEVTVTKFLCGHFFLFLEGFTCLVDWGCADTAADGTLFGHDGQGV